MIFCLVLLPAEMCLINFLVLHFFFLGEESEQGKRGGHRLYFMLLFIVKFM